MPAETTDSDRSGSFWPPRKCWTKPAAMGLRQMFAVQTIKMWPGPGMREKAE
jgi:hypothetical protein